MWLLSLPCYNERVLYLPQTNAVVRRRFYIEHGGTPRKIYAGGWKGVGGAFYHNTFLWRIFAWHASLVLFAYPADGSVCVANKASSIQQLPNGSRRTTPKHWWLRRMSGTTRSLTSCCGTRTIPRLEKARMGQLASSGNEQPTSELEKPGMLSKSLVFIHWKSPTAASQAISGELQIDQ